MSIRIRLLAMAIGLGLPFAFTANADAATRRHHRPAHVRTATYKVVPHKARAHRHRATMPTRGSVAQAPRHAVTRGS